MTHLRTAPYSPSSNGQAERFVQTFKTAMDTAKSNQAGDWNFMLQTFLLNYRATPHTRTGESPAQLMLRRSILSQFCLLRSTNDTSNKSKASTQSRKADKPTTLRKGDGGRRSPTVPSDLPPTYNLRSFELGDAVWVKD